MGRFRAISTALLFALAFATTVPLTGLSYTSPCAPDQKDRDSIIVPSNLPVGPEVGKLAPDFTLPMLGGDDSVTLSQLRGCVIILEFWASWCGPCRASSPYVEQLALRYRDQGLVMLGVSLDRFAQQAEAFLSSLGLGDMVPLWGSFEQVLAVAQAYRVLTIPHVYLIDRQGIIRFAGHPAQLTSDLIEYWLTLP